MIAVGVEDRKEKSLCSRPLPAGRESGVFRERERKRERWVVADCHDVASPKTACKEN